MDLRGANVVEDSGRIRKTPQLGLACARGAWTEPVGLYLPLLFRVHPAPPFLSGHVTVPHDARTTELNQKHAPPRIGESSSKVNQRANGELLVSSDKRYSVWCPERTP